MKKMLLSIAALAASAAVPAGAAPIVNPDNGHYYEYIANAVSFDQALAAAAASTFNGIQGYLATVTSAEEQSFIYDNVTRGGTWFAGTDRDLEGTWTWVAGPESGTIFWVGGPNGSSPTYANWAGGEPNNAGNENYLWGHWSGSGWNDIGSANLGYVIEYGGLAVGAVPEPGTWGLMILGFGAVGGALRRRRREKLALA